MTQRHTEQIAVKQGQTTLEQIANNLGYFYKNGWDVLFDNGVAIQEAVLADILAMAKDSDYAKKHGFSNVQNKEEFLQKSIN